MKALLVSALFAAAAVPTCSRQAPAPKAADYDPTEAGTVAHALCLLGFTPVPLRELSSGHHVVDVRLNGRPATFVVDTGANATVLHAAFAGEFGLGGRPTARGGATGIGGSMAAEQVRIESFALGPVETRHRRMMTTNLGQLTQLLTPLSRGPIHGIVGQDVMKEHRAVVDVDARVLHLLAEDRDPAPAPAERCRERPAPAKGK